MTIEHDGDTEEMRHVPSLETHLRKVRELRPRMEHLSRSFEANRGTDLAADREIEVRFRKVLRWLDRITEVIRHHRSSGHPEAGLRAQLAAGFDGCIGALTNMDGTRFRRRAPYHQFERSRGETILSALLSLYAIANELITLLSSRDVHLADLLFERPAIPPRIEIKPSSAQVVDAMPAVR